MKLNSSYLLFALLTSICLPAEAATDFLPGGFSRPVEWRIGVDITPAWVPPTNDFFKGQNPEDKRINTNLSGDIRADFSFNPSTLEGILYPGLYQGIGVGMDTYFSNSLLGSPVSAYVYQGAPLFHFNNRLCFGYEWQFGAAFGWKHYDEQTADNNAVVSTPVTAHMGIGLKLHYSISERWQASFGISANHYSNGNTSWPNAGVNSIGATIGIAYIINSIDKTYGNYDYTDIEIERYRWFYDITAFGSWRKRVVIIGTPPEHQLCPGKFGVLGMQFSPMCKLNRWLAVGPALDFQWDESAGIEPYWVEGTSGDDIKFERPPFNKQVSIGLSAHAELTMPIFSINIGLGYDMVNSKGNEPFFQSLTLKTFITKNIYLNTGYRLGKFKDPQNLMIGIGIRL